jgi:putative transcriptional regulator
MIYSGNEVRSKKLNIASDMIVKIQIDELLEKQKRSLYWLAKQTGISYKTLLRLKNGNALGINFATLERICSTLECLPGDVLTLEEAPKNESKPTKSIKSERVGSKT